MNTQPPPPQACTPPAPGAETTARMLAAMVVGKPYPEKTPIPVDAATLRRQAEHLRHADLAALLSRPDAADEPQPAREVGESGERVGDADGRPLLWLARADRRSAAHALITADGVLTAPALPPRH